MSDDTVLQRFQRFKAMFMSSNMPNSLLMEMIENYITANDSNDAADKDVHILDGQLSLFDAGGMKPNKTWRCSL